VSSSPHIGLPERRAAARGFDQACRCFDEADAVHGEARVRLLERLALFGLEPRCVVDLGAATGKTSLALAGQFPDAHLLAIDSSHAMLGQARRLGGSNVTRICGDAERLPLAEHSVDLMVANLVLPWCSSDVVFAEAARVLRDGGLLLFTTVGPDTLGEVRRAWSEVDDAIHVHGFVDMHDLGDLALRAGLAEPVMDVDRLQVTYRDVLSLVEDLRACGATNVALGRRTSLTGTRRWRAFRERLEARRVGGRFPVTVELIFGQAWGTGMLRQGKLGDGVTRIPVDDMTRTLAEAQLSGRVTKPGAD